MELQQPRIDLRECQTILCEKCGGMFFKETLILKKVSKLQGAAMDTQVPVPVFRCEDCGHVNTGNNPFEEELKSDKIVLDSDESIGEAVNSFIND